MLRDRLVRQQTIVLEDDAKAPPEIRHILYIHMNNIMSVDEEFPLRRQLLAKEHLNECGLARAAHTDDKDELSFSDLNVHVVQRKRAIPIYL